MAPLHTSVIGGHLLVHSGAFGGNRASRRHFIAIVLYGRKYVFLCFISSKLNNLSTEADPKVYHFTFVNHGKPHCNSMLQPAQINTKKYYIVESIKYF